jgi:uncharacterized membrane protein YhaH (DUF805 family)
MGFVEAIQSGLNNYVNFSGRASRSELWFWILFSILASVVASVIGGILVNIVGSAGSLVSLIVSLGLILPGLAVEVRRLHDIDKSGWWVLISVVPLVGIILLLIWFCTEGTRGPNRFGSNPLRTV